MARPWHWLSVLRLSRLFCEDDACPLYPQDDREHPPISALGCPSLDLALIPLPALFCLESGSTFGLSLGPTARVTQICCLGRLVPNTTASLAASEILPTGSVQAPRYYAGRSLRTLRQQSEGGQTDRWPPSIPNSFPPSRMFLPKQHQESSEAGSRSPPEELPRAPTLPRFLQSVPAHRRMTMI